MPRIVDLDRIVDAGTLTVGLVQPNLASQPPSHRYGTLKQVDICDFCSDPFGAESVGILWAPHHGSIGSFHFHCVANDFDLLINICLGEGETLFAI